MAEQPGSEAPPADLAPMLLAEVPASRLVELCEAEGWCMEQKVDGHRRLVVVEDGAARGLNRRGKPAALPPAVVEACRTLSSGTWVIDGELLEDVVWAFDLVWSPGGLVSPSSTYRERRSAIDTLISRAFGAAGTIRLVPSWCDREDKLAAARALLPAAEGVVFKAADGRYVSGRVSQDAVRVKFRRTVDCVVVARGRGGKENLTLGLYDGDQLVEVGEVTSLAGDGPKVKPGDVVEVTYIDATAMRKLRQPTLPRLRTDKDPAECTIDQLVMADRNVVDLIEESRARKRRGR